MADITKCSGDGCSMKEECYRYTANDGRWQSYFVSVPADDDGKCKHKIEVSRED